MARTSIIMYYHYIVCCSEEVDMKAGACNVYMAIVAASLALLFVSVSAAPMVSGVS